VTSAALIMVAVFSVFATMSVVDLKILGVGTAAAGLIDATVVRGVLLPTAFSLLGRRALTSVITCRGRRRRSRRGGEQRDCGLGIRQDAARPFFVPRSGAARPLELAGTAGRGGRR
jgi:hypothetical protein